MDNEENKQYNDNNQNKVKFITISLIISLTLVITIVILACIYVITKSVFLSDTSISTTNLKGDSKTIAAISEALDMLNKKYIDIYDIDEDELLDNILTGVAASVGDPYTRYMSEEEYQEMLISGTEEYSGIGIHLTYDKEMDAMIILGIMPESPALKADLQIGDYIVEVEGNIVTYENYQKCVDIMKGQENTDVKIVISRDGKLIEKKITRRKIQVNNVESEVLDGDIGYIKILQFDNDIYNQFKIEYDKLIKQNVKGLVIDVRNNPGGLVTETIKILDLLLPKCEVLKLEYRDGKNKIYKCSNNDEINIPLTILVNKSSASAAEILASAIKDANKGVVIGTQTFGKGIVQEIEKLKTRGALSITVAKYYTASGVEINKNGIEPNIAVDLPDELKKKAVVPKEEDTQLQKAIDYIKQNQ